MHRSLTPAQDEIEARRIRDEIEKCGKNMGPHDYVPIEWFYVKRDGIDYKRVNRFLCRVCFNTINTATLIGMYKDISQRESDDIASKTLV